MAPSRGVTVGDIPMAAIMDAKRQMAKKTTSARRILAISLYLRKYLRRVIRAVRCDEEDRAQMYRTRTKCAP